MTYDQAERFYGSQGALARAFHPHVAQGSVSLWKKTGKVPRGRQFELQVLTGGQLTADRRFLRR